MSSEVTLEDLERAIQHIPPSRRREVLLFIEFLENRDEDEDAHLWEAVKAHQSYRAAHPHEQPDVFKTGEDFLRATEAL
jgi:hypothetical protein